MSRSKGPAYTPDGVTAAEATVAASEKSEAAEGLVRGEEVRVAAADALIHASETDDEADTGSQVPTDATERARGLARVYRHVRRRMGVEGEDPREGQEGHGRGTQRVTRLPTKTSTRPTTKPPPSRAGPRKAACRTRARPT